MGKKHASQYANFGWLQNKEKFSFNVCKKGEITNMQYPYNNKNWKFLHKQSRLKQFNRILAYLSDSYQFIQHV